MSSSAWSWTVFSPSTTVGSVLQTLREILRHHMVIYLFVTDADGVFRFDGVPAGRYTMVTWQEKLGVRTQVVLVTQSVETRVAVTY